MKRCILAALLLLVAPVHAEEAAAPPSDSELAKQLSNPVADLTSLPLQFNWENGVGPDDELRTVINFQPVVPFHITPKWNLIGRWIMPFVSQPALTPGGEATSGVGDIVASGFFSPAGRGGHVTWGVGPVLSLPMTTDPALGSGQWGIGPTAVVLVQRGPWTYGALVNHVWGIADTGDVERADVSQSFLQPFLAYQFPGALTLTLQSESTYNWEAESGEAWTIPINVIVSKVTKMGTFPFSVGGGAGYYADSPSIGPDWKLRAVFTLLLPGKK